MEKPPHNDKTDAWDAVRRTYQEYRALRETLGPEYLHTLEKLRTYATALGRYFDALVRQSRRRRP